MSVEETLWLNDESRTCQSIAELEGTTALEEGTHGARSDVLGRSYDDRMSNLGIATSSCQDIYKVYGPGWILLSRTLTYVVRLLGLAERLSNKYRRSSLEDQSSFASVRASSRA